MGRESAKKKSDPADADENEAAAAVNVDTSSKQQSPPSSRKQQSAAISEEIWISDDFALTWPIWHLLPLGERKDLALKHGFEKIGDFEEYMSLQRAVGDSTTTPTSSSPYSNDLVYSNLTEPAADSIDRKEDERKHKSRLSDDEDDDDQSSTDEKLDEEMETERVAATDRLPLEELVEVGGSLLMLPEDMLHRIFDWLPVDAYATLALVSPHWRSFTRTEAVYKRLCERLYLNQSKRRALHVSRFGNSYRTMLEMRPRVRAGGGVYVMQYRRVKPIQRDMWTEIPRGVILEMVYYRYLYFQEDGRVLYALTSSPPQEMFRRFLRVCLSREEDQAAVWGTYQVHKRHVTVTAKQAWQYVKLDLTIEQNNMHGRYGILSFDSHVTNTNGNFDESYYCPNQVVYETPDEPFRFVEDKRL